MKINKFISTFFVILLSIFAFYLIDILNYYTKNNKEEVQEYHIEEEDEIELSDNAMKNFNIKTKNFTFDFNIITLPKTAVIVSQDEYFVYTKNNEHFKEIKIEPLKITKEDISFEYNDKNQEFVIDGVNFLRVVFLNNGNTAGHSH